MLLLSTNGTIVPEPVNCYPGSAEGSHWTFNKALSSSLRLITLTYETISDKYMTLELKRQK